MLIGAPVEVHNSDFSMTVWSEPFGINFVEENVFPAFTFSSPSR